MKAIAEKSHKQNQTGAVAKQGIYQKSNGQTPLAFVDHRQGSASYTGLQLMVDRSPRTVAQRKRLEGAFGGSVQRQSEAGSLQIKVEPVQRMDFEDEEELLQGKFESVQRIDPEDEEELMQGKFATEQAPIQRVGRTDDPENRTGLPDQLKTGVETLSGLDMSDVRVHYNSAKPAQLNALAYAQGRDIHVGPGQAKHVPHEAWHAVQQKQGRVKPTMQLAGAQINDDAGLEQEADVMGRKAAIRH